MNDNQDATDLLADVVRASQEVTAKARAAQEALTLYFAAMAAVEAAPPEEKP